MIFPKEEQELLLNLFKIYAPSRKETPVIEFIEKYLSEKGIPYTKDLHGNLFNLSYEGRPLLSAHMDSVGDADCGYMNAFVNIFDYRGDQILRGVGNIGGDDKCGIFLTLRKITKEKNINFIFSIGEEVGSIGINQVLPAKELDKIPYGLVLDRRGFGDIICNQNSYGSLEFEDALTVVGKEFSFTPARGSFSDANCISKYINCANLSVGYHNPHSKKEYVSLKQLLNTGNYVDEIFKQFEGRKFDLKKPSYATPTTSTYAYDDDYYTGTGYKREQYAEYYKGKFYCPICKVYRENKLKVFVKNREFLCQICADDIKNNLSTK